MGRTLSRVPNSSNCTPTWPRPAGTGTACSPPDRKLAGRPLRVTTEGRARIFASDSLRRACRKPRYEVPLLTTPRKRLEAAGEALIAPPVKMPVVCCALPPLPPLLKAEGGVVPAVGRTPAILPTVLPKIALGPLTKRLKPKLRAAQSAILPA